MAEQDSAQEKTEEPSAKRLQEAREKGQVPRSQELTTVMVLMASAAAMFIVGEGLVQSLTDVMKLTLNLERSMLFDVTAMTSLLWQAVKIMALDLGFFLAITVVFKSS